MSYQAGGEVTPSTTMEPPGDDRLVLKWLESQPAEAQSDLTAKYLEDYLAKAAQPRHVSGNACIKLCYFIEQCMKSKSSLIGDVIFSEKPCLDLFNFYIEWNEKNQNRSMRQVIELVSTLIAKNPDEETTCAIKKAILERNLVIITHQAAQPLVKPAFKSLESLMGKGTIHARDVLDVYKRVVITDRSHGANGVASPADSAVIVTLPKEPSDNTDGTAEGDSSSWDSFFSEMFDWMTFADISPAAGKFLVTVFRDLRTTSGSPDIADNSTASWQRWIRRGLGRNPEALENVKNYLFPPLFKLDRIGSLAFLGDLNKKSPVWDMQSQDMDAQSLLQLSAMDTGKKAGLVEEPDSVEFQKVSKKPSGTVILKEDSIGSLLTHESETVRSLAFSVLTSSLSTIRPFSGTALNILQSNMYILHSDTDAKFRNEILSSTKHMIERLRGAASFLVREVESLSFQINGLPESQQEEGQQRLAAIKAMLQSHDDFISWYIEFLLLELIPTASYQRHITALKAISLLLRSGILKKDIAAQSVKISGNNTVWPYAIDFFSLCTLRLLMDLLLDPFEDVRSGATNVLKMASPNNFDSWKPLTGESMEDTLLLDTLNKQRKADGLPVYNANNDSPEFPADVQISLGLLLEFIDRAEEISKLTGRADHADGVARSYELLYGLQISAKGRMEVIAKLVQNLETKVKVAERSLGQAVSEAPIHGTFAALTFVWDSVDHFKDFLDTDPEQVESHVQLERLQERMAGCCTRIWQAVRDILCNDSPEGHLPQDLDEIDEVDTKDVLSYSFRAIHESSNLMRTLVNKIRLKNPSSSLQPLLPAHIFIQIGNLSFEQLSSLRHRGAFSTVSLTFATCCQVAMHPSILNTTSKLILKWNQGAMDCISTQVSTTRRSAGIPALITGILSANAPTPSLAEVMEELILVAQKPVLNLDLDESQLPQVHALNCIREMVKTPTIRHPVEPFMARLFELSLGSLRSKKYAVRNCGLMLFRSLADSIFGTSPSKVDIEVGWDGKSIKVSYDKYPSLPEMIIKLLRMGVGDTILPALDFLRRAGPPGTQTNEVQDLVSGFLKHEAWQIRETAAHTLCSLTMGTPLVDIVRTVLNAPQASTNGRHGTLMATKVILQRRLPMAGQSSSDVLSQIVPDLIRYWNTTIFQSHCQEVVASYVEVRNVILSFCLQVPVQDMALLTRLKQEIGPLLSLDLKRETGNDRTRIEGSPSLDISMSRGEVLLLALDNDLTALAEALHHISGSDALIGALRCTSDVWRLEKQDGLLKYLCGVHCWAIQDSCSPEVQKTAVEGLCHILDVGIKAPYTGEMAAINTVLDLKPSIDKITCSPAFSNLWTELSGWIAVFEIITLSTGVENLRDVINTAPTLRSWSRVWTFLGAESQDFDTRYAAAYAVCTFYTHLDYFFSGRDTEIPITDRLVPSMFALYNILDDDDSEIRNLGAKAVSAILRQSLVPQAAQKALASHMLKQRGESFLSYVVSRMTGTPTDRLDNDSSEVKLEPARTQLDQASQGDNKLFTEEKQNLWHDEVRDAEIWCEIFQKIPLGASGMTGFERFDQRLMTSLSEWITNATKTLTEHSRKDTALGWTSKPEVFAVVFRTIKCINACWDYTEQNILPPTSPNAAEWKQKSLQWRDDLCATIEQLEELVACYSRIGLHPVLLQTLLPVEQHLGEPSSLVGNLIPINPIKVSLTSDNRS